MELSRRSFLRGTLAGLAAAALPVPIPPPIPEPVRRYWQVPRGAPVPSRWRGMDPAYPDVYTAEFERKVDGLITAGARYREIALVRPVTLPGVNALAKRLYGLPRPVHGAPLFLSAHAYESLVADAKALAGG